MIGKDKQIFYICIIIIGMIIALPFNYIYGMGGFEVDVIWAIFGIVMIASGVHLLKKQNKTKKPQTLEYKQKMFDSSVKS